MAVLDDFRRYLLDERALAVTTAEEYLRWVTPLADELCAPNGAPHWTMLDASMVTGFIAKRGRGLAPGSRSVLASATRAFLGWVRVQGWVAADLSGVVFSHANLRSRLPERVSLDDVDAMLAATDPAARTGLRDRAVITMLHRLGLRPGEVAGLTLDDIDWAAGTLRVVGKGQRALVLPIPDDVGRVLETYLLGGGYPDKAADRKLFSKVRAPLTALTPGNVNAIVSAAARRAGLGAVSARQLRHAAATRVVNTGGSLAEAGQLLGHSRPSTTAIYARVGVEALRPLAREWGV